MGTERIIPNEESGTEKGRGRWEGKRCSVRVVYVGGSLAGITEHLGLCLDRAVVGVGGSGSASSRFIAGRVPGDSG